MVLLIPPNKIINLVIFNPKDYERLLSEYCLFSWRYNPLWLYFHSPVAGLASSFLRFLDHTQRRATVGRTPLDEWSIRRRDLYLTTRNSQQTNIHAHGGIRTHSLSRRAAEDLCLRPRGHWDKLYQSIACANCVTCRPTQPGKQNKNTKKSSVYDCTVEDVE